MTTTSTSDPMIGRVLDGRYTVERRIARGGMAVVYAATDSRLHRRVAIKILHDGLSADAEFLRKFDREARAAAGLNHRNIVAVFDQGDCDDRPYMVMELVEGSTLRSLINRDSPLEPARALALFEPVIAALAAAHRGGIVHRDVKPENVLISETGQVKVADFGLARAVSADTVTATQGLVMGTVSYIPPEVVQRGKADPRSDVYSAGIVLFEMLTGRKPHTGESPIQVAYAHCNTDVPPPSSVLPTAWRSQRTAIPDYLDALVQVATCRNPHGRPTDASSFADRVRAVRAALERGETHNPQLAADIARPDADRGEPTTALGTGAAAPRTWRQATPNMPVSPVDLPTGGDGFYDAISARASQTARPPGDSSFPRFRLRRPRVLVRSGATAVAKPNHRANSSSQAVTKRRPQHRWGRFVIFMLSLLLVIGVSYGSWWTFAGQYTTVPQMAGLTKADAEAAARQSTLEVTFAEEFSETVDKNVVIRTAPVVGTKIRKHDVITAYLSKGPERFAVPTLVGRPLAEAKRALASSSLETGAVTEAYNETAAVGIVVSASQEPGTQLKKGTTIDLVVSKGPQPIDIPTNLAGKKRVDAEKTLTDLGFKVAVTENNHKTVPAGTVIDYAPATGQGKRGDTITLNVSKGPVMVLVPQTRNLTTSEAKKTLESAGFKVAQEKLPNLLPLERVSYSIPEGGSQAPEGSTITIYTV